MSALPQLRLEQDPADQTLVHLRFDPHPSTWSFDDARGSKDELRTHLAEQVGLFMATATPDARFDHDAQQTLRQNIRHLLLQWIGFRGLHVPSCG